MGSIAATEILSLSEENSKGLVSTSDSHTMSFLKQLEEKKNALKKTEVSRKENTGPQEMIMKETEDYYRMLKETYFEAYYDRIEEYTFKSVIIPMTIDDTKALMDIVVDDAGKVWVVEVNPFGEMAGSCLFEWSR